MMKFQRRNVVCFITVLLILGGCAGSAVPSPTAQPLADELILYNWEDDIPQSVLDMFTQEYGVKVKYIVYESQDEAIANMRAGKAYDVVTMEGRDIPLLVREHILTVIDLSHVPNFKNVSANFRNLIYDPDNRYSIPYNWGTTGLVVRSDLIPEPVTRWADLWDPRYAGRIGIWAGQSREVIALTLLALGYSANSENPTELAAVLDRLLKIKPHVHFLEDFDLNDSSKVMASGQVWISMGYAADAIRGHEINPAIRYVMPEEGALLWGDTFVIPASSPHPYTAEVFLNFMLRPEISAQMVNEQGYPMANDAARSLIHPDILNNPVIYPHDDDLKNASLILPLSPEGQTRYDNLWKHFLAAGQ